jgi:hypothetical protein
MALPHIKDWDSRPVDVDFFIDSGLLFELNRQFLHPLGIALAVRAAADGQKTWAFKDHRARPGELTFSKDQLENGRRKFVRFLRAAGGKVMARRDRALGSSVQHVEPSWD